MEKCILIHKIFKKKERQKCIMGQRWSKRLVMLLVSLLPLRDHRIDSMPCHAPHTGREPPKPFTMAEFYKFYIFAVSSLLTIPLQYIEALYLSILVRASAVIFHLCICLSGSNLLWLLITLMLHAALSWAVPSILSVYLHLASCKPVCRFMLCSKRPFILLNRLFKAALSPVCYTYVLMA